MWKNRPSLQPEQKFRDIEKELSLANLKNEFRDTFPAAEEIAEGEMVLVDYGGTQYIVTKRNGTRLRASFTAF